MLLFETDQGFWTAQDKSALSSLFSFETDAASQLRYKTNAEHRLTKCINIKGSLLKCLCGSPEAAFKKCFVQNDSIEDTPLGDKPNVSDINMYDYI